MLKILKRLLAKVLALKAKRAKSDIPKIEAKLIKTISTKLSSQKQKRYELLTQKRWDEKLTDSEHQELISISNEIEELDSKRAEAIFTLSQIRGVKPDTLMKELG